MCYPVAHPLQYLAGRWELSRRVVDIDAGVEGSFIGVATFTYARAGLDYVEQGVLDFGSHRGQAGRALRYRSDGSCRLIVEFTDGRFFHDLDLRDGRWRMHHPCGDDDDYYGEMTVLSAHHWQQTWRVTGPAKQQSLESDYIRC